jgi:hypothetical protein
VYDDGAPEEGQAVKFRWKRDEFLKDADGLAIDGVDSVSYFGEGGPTRGKPEHEASWRGARWRFVSAANRQAFLSDPAKYAPQCGGYCAFAVSLSDNDRAPPAPPGRPDLWTIIDGKLYLNTNAFAHYMFRIFRLAKRADATWVKRSA